MIWNHRRHRGLDSCTLQVLSDNAMMAPSTRPCYFLCYCSGADGVVYVRVGRLKVLAVFGPAGSKFCLVFQLELAGVAVGAAIQSCWQCLILNMACL